MSVIKKEIKGQTVIFYKMTMRQINKLGIVSTGLAPKDNPEKINADVYEKIEDLMFPYIDVEGKGNCLEKYEEVFRDSELTAYDILKLGLETYLGNLINAAGVDSSPQQINSNLLDMKK